MRRITRALALVVVVMAIAVHAAPWRSLTLPLHYNVTASLPQGLYRAQAKQSITRGDIVRVCVPAQVARMGRRRGYLGSGSCPEQTAPIGKMVVGLPGDTVHVDKRQIRVGSRLVLSAPLQDRDTRGRRVQGALGTHVLGADECFVLSTFSQQSFDSRYFGPVACVPPVVVLTPHSRKARRELDVLRRALQGRA